MALRLVSQMVDDDGKVRVYLDVNDRGVAVGLEVQVDPSIDPGAVTVRVDWPDRGFSGERRIRLESLTDRLSPLTRTDRLAWPDALRWRPQDVPEDSLFPEGMSFTCSYDPVATRTPRQR